MRLQPIYDIAALCAAKGINQVILCPGSRCAPLTLAFARHPSIHTRTIFDERSAAFIALGMAQQLQQPVALVCTSGTAAANFAPAVAEAFFQQIPLLIFTADRPAEWIGQYDGQTIHQPGLYQQHVKHSFNLPQEYDHPDNKWVINRTVNEAINQAHAGPKGPVHINVPLREPLYPLPEENITFDERPRVIHETSAAYELDYSIKQDIQNHLKHFNRILIVVGQSDYDPVLLHSLQKYASRASVPVVSDILGNVHSLENVISHADNFLGHAGNDIKDSLRPDLLITFGKSVIAKNLKLFLRNYRAAEHWHIQPNGPVADTYQNVTQVLRTTPNRFFEFLNTFKTDESFESQKQRNYAQLWLVEQRKATRLLEDFFPQEPLGELEAVASLLRQLPARCNLHLANSMSVRYANYVGLVAESSGIRVFANRGTSGIDGCTSTAVGHSLVNADLNVLITGDMAFFYDRNAFWHNYPLPNLRVLLLNNHGGVIFKVIDGPGTLPEADEYFVTQQKLNARKLCEEFGFEYQSFNNRRKFTNLLADFLEPDSTTKVLEIETDTRSNVQHFNNFKQKIKQSYER